MRLMFFLPPPVDERGQVRACGLSEKNIKLSGDRDPHPGSRKPDGIHSRQESESLRGRAARYRRDFVESQTSNGRRGNDLTRHDQSRAGESPGDRCQNPDADRDDRNVPRHDYRRRGRNQTKASRLSGIIPSRAALSLMLLL